MKPRNPHATNLRHHKPKRIEDKRDRQAEKQASREADEAVLESGGTVSNGFFSCLDLSGATIRRPRRG